MNRPFRTALVVLLALAFAATVGACPGGGSRSKTGSQNVAPAIGAPTGPGTVWGTDPTYTTVINLGDSLDFSVMATDADAADSLIFTASVTGGSLTETQAGFTTFPSMTTGTSAQVLSFAGTAAQVGDIEITFLVDDGKGAMDTITHSVEALPASPVRAWGDNQYGKLGDGTTTDRWTPVQVVDPSDPTGFLTGVVAVTAGGAHHTVALLGDGTVRAWGWNNDGQLGDGTTTSSSTPVQVIDPSDPTGFLTGVTAVAAGLSHTVALLGDGTLRAWGDNQSGKLGDGTTTDRWTPAQVVDPSDPTGFLTGVIAVAAGSDHTVALLGDGTVRAWGSDGDGRLGDGTGGGSSTTPVQVVDPTDPTGFLTGVTALEAGGGHTVALLGDGTLRAWGSNFWAQLGDGTTTARPIPVQVEDPSDPTGLLTGVAAVVGGGIFTVALLGDGTLRAWGVNLRGELGDGMTYMQSSTPVQVVDPSDPTGFLSGVAAVEAGGGHTLALLSDGTVRAWGDNQYGRLGDGTTTDSSTPVQVVDPSDPTGFLTGVIAVAPHAIHSVALR